ncbi:MAG: phosphoribosylaminoimidazolesuccinocarboxamide synthase [Candidatus Bipolaricaulota bacterium]|nr:phosphoribosylaminoimidazolesuccinocarboxamide synthase [Candidatus Bipolaricaulota bacterium]
MSYRFGIFGSFGGQTGIRLVEEILMEVRRGTIRAQVPFIFSSRAGDEEGNAALLNDLAGPEIDVVTLSARRFRPGLFRTDRNRWRNLYHSEAMNRISGYRFDAILLVGYMFFTSDELCQRYNLLNLHPAPPGGPKGGWREVIWRLVEEEAQEAGAQIHLATSAWDAGPPVAYFTFPIQGGGFDPLWKDLYRKLEKRPFAQIKAAEYETNPLVNKIREIEVQGELPLLIQTLRWLADGDVKIKGTGKGASVFAFGRRTKTGHPLNERTNFLNRPSPKDPLPGSVKHLRILKFPAGDEAGTGSFLFTDHYSVFDWGRMPDLLWGKGKVLCMMSAYNFELLEHAGIKTHYRGLMVEEKTVPYGSLEQAASGMAITVVAKPILHWTKKGYDYPRYFREAGRNFLIPLEVIYRRAVPIGSSLRDRYTPQELGLDYPDWPKVQVELPRPMVEFSTKFERFDRSIDREESLKISGLSESLFYRLEEIALNVAEILASHARRQGLEIADGKLELAVCGGELIVCDTVGTPDENRFRFSGHAVDKEILRQYYRRADPEWVTAVARAKEECVGRTGWQKQCPRSPVRLAPGFLDLCSEVYRAVANKYLAKPWFEARELEEVVAELEKWDQGVYRC